MLWKCKALMYLHYQIKWVATVANSPNPTGSMGLWEEPSHVLTAVLGLPVVVRVPRGAPEVGQDCLPGDCPLKRFFCSHKILLC